MPVIAVRENKDDWYDLVARLIGEAKQKLSLFTISSIFFKSSVIVYLNILLKIDKKAIY